jgi:hypothetical protein
MATARAAGLLPVTADLLMASAALLTPAGWGTAMITAVAAAIGAAGLVT